MKQWLAIFLLIGTMAHAQSYEQDILRFSYNDYNGTARFVGVGGAFSSVGADFTNLSHNPAGIGMYRTTIATVSPAVVIPKTTSSYLGDKRSKTQPQLVFGSAGIILSMNNLNTNKSSLINNVSLGIGLNRMADFNRKEVFDGFNETGSITNRWRNEVVSINGADDLSVDYTNGFSFDAYNAYWAYLVNYDSSVLAYTTPVQDSVQQQRIMTTNGGKNEIVFSLGANYLDKLYFGATVGIPYLNYERNTVFQEEDEFDVNANFNSFTNSQDYSTTGVGFNFKAGVIYKPASFVRVGVAIQSPEKLFLTEEYYSKIESNVFSQFYSSESPTGEFDYDVRLPWRVNSGISFFYKNYGFVSFDYEMVDYASMKYIFKDEFIDEEEQINQNIKDAYKSAHNFRAGLEVVPIKKLRLRAGYSYQGSPFKDNVATQEYDFVTHQMSGGFGIVHNRIAFDMTYRHSIRKEIEYPYAGAEAVKKEIVKPMITASIAYKLF